MQKIYLNIDVYEAALKRIEYVFKEFEKDVFLAFSGGKDSSLMLNLCLVVAEKLDLLPLKVFFIDTEAQYSDTINHVEEMLDSNKVEAFWICLPISLRNSASMLEPKWIPWDTDKKELWVREIPKKKYIISEENIPEEWEWFKKGMEFEELFFEFGKWLSKKNASKKMASIIAIRADESFKRFSTMVNSRKTKYNSLFWSTKVIQTKDIEIYNFYPIYDWKVKDIWLAIYKNSFLYNEVYEKFYKVGELPYNMRLCQPYGDTQKKSLELYQKVDFENWKKISIRVEGANFITKYDNKKLLGIRGVQIPEGYSSYKEYVFFLLFSMPMYLRVHYIRKINVFLSWWCKKLEFESTGYEEIGLLKVDIIPDKCEKSLENNKEVPSWRRICKVLLKNDYYCYGLGFNQNKNEYKKLMDLKIKYKEN